MSATTRMPANAAMDMQDPVPELAPGLVEQLARAERYGLIGSRCPDCGAWAFPALKRCPHCQGQPRTARVGTGGRLYTYTVVRTRAPFGLPEPYAVGYVDLDESGLRVFGLIDPQAVEVLEVGQRMEIGLRPLGMDGQGRPCRRPLFLLAGQATRR